MNFNKLYNLLCCFIVKAQSFKLLFCNDRTPWRVGIKMSRAAFVKRKDERLCAIVKKRGKAQVKRRADVSDNVHRVLPDVKAVVLVVLSEALHGFKAGDNFRKNLRVSQKHVCRAV